MVIGISIYISGATLVRAKWQDRKNGTERSLLIYQEPKKDQRTNFETFKKM